MQAHDIRDALKGVGVLAITPAMTEEDAMAAMRPIGTFNQCLLGLTRFSGQTPWERHPGGDELLQVLDGDVDVTVLTDEGRMHATLRPGSVCVVPSGLWHRQHAVRGVALLFATPVEGGETSWAEDPR
jgi:mannose-6-phosphate isomerase-like protein (cupin superfamily)